MPHRPDQLLYLLGSHEQISSALRVGRYILPGNRLDVQGGVLSVLTTFPDGTCVTISSSAVRLEEEANKRQVQAVPRAPKTQLEASKTGEGHNLYL